MLSVVIPTKNEEFWLPKLLASIKAQTMQPYEVIIADAQSHDLTREVALRYGAKVVDGGGVAKGRNNGAQKAKGDFIFFLDADVVLKDEKFFEKAVGEMVERNLDLATCDVEPISKFLADKVLHNIYNTYVRVCGSFIPHAPGFCLLVRRKTHEAVNGFDESIVFCEDHDYAKRIAKNWNFGFLRSVKIQVSIRRLDRDGRLMIALKYILAEMHILFLGPIKHNKFNYTFGHASEGDSKKKL